jgi:hypothetical protein
VDVPDALDRWFPKVVKPRCRGEACLMRGADDCVCACQHQVDAERFSQAWGQRLSTVGLEVSADQRRVIPVSRQQALGRTSFDCLGVECRWGQDWTGKPHLKRRPSRQKRRTSRTRRTDGCKEPCRSRRKDWCRELQAKLRGSDHDYGGNGNAASLRECCNGARRILCRWLNRRSQRRSYTWAGFRTRLHHFRVERPRRVGHPSTRLAAGRAEAGLRQRVCLKSLVREHCTPGSVRGRAGDWPSYRDGGKLYGTYYVINEAKNDSAHHA